MIELRRYVRKCFMIYVRERVQATRLYWPLESTSGPASRQLLPNPTTTGQSCKTSTFGPDRHSAQPDPDIPPLILLHLTPDQPSLAFQARPFHLPVKPFYFRWVAAGFTAVGDGTRLAEARLLIRQLNETYAQETKLTNLYDKHGAAARPKAKGAEFRRERAAKLMESFSVYDETYVPL